MKAEPIELREPLISKTPEGTTPINSLCSSSDRTRKEFSELISHFSTYQPSFISTPFKGTSLQITRDGKNFVFGSQEGRIAVCNIDEKQLTLDKNLEEGKIWNIDITTDNNSVYSGGQGGKIKKFSLNTLDSEGELVGHTDEVNAVMISQNDEFLYSCSDDHTVRKWDLSTQKSEILYNHEDLVYALDLSEDNVHLASGSKDGTVIVYNLFDYGAVFQQKIEEASVWCVRISSKNVYLIAGDDRPKISVWSFGN